MLLSPSAEMQSRCCRQHVVGCVNSVLATHPPPIPLTDPPKIHPRRSERSIAYVEFAFSFYRVAINVETLLDFGVYCTEFKFRKK